MDDIEIYVASIDDMISMKKASNRPKDLSDMEMLKEAHRITEQTYEQGILLYIRKKGYCKLYETLSKGKT